MTATKKTTKAKSSKKTQEPEEKTQTPTNMLEDLYAMMKRHPRMSLLMVGYILGWISHTLLV